MRDYFFYPYLMHLQQQPFDFPGFPFFIPGMPPFTPPGMSPYRPDGPPTSPPPPYVPDKSPFRVDPGSIRPCKYKYTYLWLENGDEFWSYPIYISRKSLSGYRWRRFRWVYFGTDLKNIESFICV